MCVHALSIRFNKEDARTQHTYVVHKIRTLGIPLFRTMYFISTRTDFDCSFLQSDSCRKTYLVVTLNFRVFLNGLNFDTFVRFVVSFEANARALLLRLKAPSSLHHG